MDETDEPLDVDMSGKSGTKMGVAIVLDSVATLMKDMPDEARFDFELSITETTDPEEYETNND